MAGKTHAMHGRDHRPGGADPIPADVETSYPLSSELIDPAIATNVGYLGLNGLYSCTWPVTIGTGLVAGTGPFGYYYENNPITDQDVESVFYARLGPRGSLWSVMIWYWKQSDAGKFKVGIRCISEDDTASGWYTTPPGPGAGDPTDLTGLISTDFTTPAVFYPGDVTGALGWGMDFDCYSVVAGWQFDYSNLIRPMGVDGYVPDTITTDWVTGSFFGMGLSSGSGIYEIRITPNGKNAASSGYRKRLGSIRLQRFTGNWIPTT